MSRLIVQEKYKIYICKHCNIKTNKDLCPKCFEELKDYEIVILKDVDTSGFFPA